MTGATVRPDNVLIESGQRAAPRVDFSPTPEAYRAKGTTQRQITMKCTAVAETVMMWNTSW